MSCDLPRFIPNIDEASLKADDNPRANLRTSLTALVRGYPPTTEPSDGFRGLFKGPSSVAFLFLKLSKLYSGDEKLVIEGKGCLEWCASYLDAGQLHPVTVSNVRWGIIDESLVRIAIRASLNKDGGLVQELCGWATVIAADRDDDEGSNEWFNGRAGYLYLLRAVKSWFTDKKPFQRLLEDTAEIVIDRILTSQRPWQWYGTPWISVGAAHGIIGIITQIILTSPSRARELRTDLETVLRLQRHDGNWGMKIPDDDQKSFCQFCHGAPGVVVSLLSLKQHFPELLEEIDDRVKMARDWIWEKGLLTKEPCLCHGISGNALALERNKFEKFLSKTTVQKVAEGIKEGIYKESDAPWSLFCGEAGRAWCWAVVDKEAEFVGKFIGYNDV